jgi:hypothetical protein
MSRVLTSAVEASLTCNWLTRRMRRSTTNSGPSEPTVAADGMPARRSAHNSLQRSRSKKFSTTKNPNLQKRSAVGMDG